MDEKSKILQEHSTRVVECSSKFSHDISGKVHIVQFCLDEILEARPDLMDDPFFSKMSKGIEHLSDVLVHFRSTLQDELKLTHKYSLAHYHERALRLLRVYGGQKALGLRIKCQSMNESELFGWQMGEVLFAFYSFYYEFLEKSEATLRESQLSLSLLDSGECGVKLEFEGILFTENDLQELIARGDYHEKTMRRKLGFNLLKELKFSGNENKITIDLYLRKEDSNE